VMSFEPTILGRTGLRVGRMGLAAGYGVPAEAVEEAFERGVNYFYWGALRRSPMAEGIRRLAKKDRDKLVVTVQNYWPLAKLIPGSLRRALRELGLDYADILLYSTFRKRPNQRSIDAGLELKEKGLVRHLGLACHLRSRFAESEKEKIFDVFHVRYNAVHPGAEKDVFPHLSTDGGPGIVIFTATCHTRLLRRSYLPKGERIPMPVDCYRFVLSHSAPGVCLCGPRDMKEFREDTKVFQKGPMTEDEGAQVLPHSESNRRHPGRFEGVWPGGGEGVCPAGFDPRGRMLCKQRQKTLCQVSGQAARAGDL
jgi:predicted aldo/keto reductase-like oxidoreductase